MLATRIPASFTVYRKDDFPIWISSLYHSRYAYCRPHSDEMARLCSPETSRPLDDVRLDLQAD